LRTKDPARNLGSFSRANSCILVIYHSSCHCHPARKVVASVRGRESRPSFSGMGDVLALQPPEYGLVGGVPKEKKTAFHIVVWLRSADSTVFFLWVCFFSSLSCSSPCGGGGQHDNGFFEVSSAADSRLDPRWSCCQSLMVWAAKRAVFPCRTY
jgi:hypothetical protein